VLRTNSFQNNEEQMQQYLSRLFADNQVKISDIMSSFQGSLPTVPKEQFNYTLLQ